MMARRHVSWSQISRYVTCQQQYNYSYRRNLTRQRREIDNLTIGSCIHSILETRLMGADPHSYIHEDWLLELGPLDEFSRARAEEVGEYGLELVERIFEESEIDTWETVEHDGVPMIEFNFSIPIKFGTRTIDFTGVIDWAARTPTGEILLVDWKTKKNLNTEIKEEINWQFAIYTYVLKYHCGIDIDGAMMVQIRREKPKRASTDLYRILSVPIDKTVIESVWANTLSVIRDMIYKRKYTKNWNWFSCNMCYFRQICDAETRGEDTTFLMDTVYQEKGEAPKMFIPIEVSM